MAKGNGFDTPQLKKLEKKNPRMRTVLRHLRTNDGKFGTPDNRPEPERRPGHERISEHESKINLVGKDHRFEYLYEEMRDSKTRMHGSLSGFFGKKNSAQYNAVTEALGEVINRTNTVFKEFTGDNMRMLKDTSNAYFRLIEACDSYLEKDGGTTKSGAARKDRVKMIKKLAKDDITAIHQCYFDIQSGKISEDEQSKLNWQDILFSGREATIEVDDLHNDEAFKALGANNKAGDKASRKLNSGVFTKKDTVETVKSGKFNGIALCDIKNNSNEDGGYGKKTDVTKRNVATSRMAALLGLSGLVQDSKTVKVKDKASGKTYRGNLMEFANGDEAKGVAKQKSDELVKKTDNIEERLKEAQSMFAPSVQKELSSLQVLDYLCGQGDRHRGNYFLEKDENDKYAHVHGIDNDMSFSTGVDFSMSDMDSKAGFVQVHMRYVVDEKGNLAIPYMDRQLAKNILHTKPDMIRFALKDLLEPKYIENTIERFLKVQKAIETEGLESKRFKEGEDWGEASANALVEKTLERKLLRNEVNEKDSLMETGRENTYFAELILATAGYNFGTNARKFETGLTEKNS